MGTVQEGMIDLGDTGPQLIALLVRSVIEDNDQKALWLLKSCWPEDDWETEIAKCRAEFYMEWQGELRPYLPVGCQLTMGGGGEL